MSTQLNDNFLIKAPKPNDSRYCKFSGGAAVPYASIAEANSLLPMAYRYAGLTVLINEGGSPKEYSYQGGVNDANLLYKLPEIERRVKQVGHPFSGGMAVYKDSNQVWQRSNANSAAASCVYGVVTKVLDADNFIVGRQGDIFAAPNGLAANTDYWLETTTSGINYTDTPPLNTPNKFVKKIFRTNATGEAIIEIEPGYQTSANVFPQTLPVANYAAATQGSTPIFYEVNADETNGNVPTLYFWSGTRMFRLSSTLGGTTTTTTAATTTTTTTAATTTTTAGTTTTTTAGTTTTTTTGSNPFDQEILMNFVGQYIPDVYSGVAHVNDPDDTHVPAGTAGKTNLKNVLNVATTVGIQMTSPGIGFISGIPNGEDPNSDTVFAKAGVARQSWLLADGTTMKITGLVPGGAYRAYFWSYAETYNHIGGHFTINGVNTADRDCAGNTGTAAGAPLADPALDYADFSADGSGEANITAHHASGDAGVVLTALYLGRYSGGTTTTTTTAGTTTTTTAATTTTTTTAATTTTTTSTTTTTTSTTTTTTAGTTTTTTTAGGPPEYTYINMGNEYQATGPYANWNYAHPLNSELTTPNGVNYTNLKRIDGTTGTLSITNSNAWISYYNSFNASPADSGIWVDAIAAFGWRYADGAQLSIGGLTVGASYTIYFYGHANSWEAGTQTFTIGGNTSAVQNTSDNFGDAATYPDTFSDPALVSVTFTATAATHALTCNVLTGTGTLSVMVIKKN